MTPFVTARLGEPGRVPLKDSLLAVLVVTIWGTNFVVVDTGLDGVPALLFLAMRFVVVLLPAVSLVPRPQALWQEPPAADRRRCDDVAWSRTR